MHAVMAYRIAVLPSLQEGHEERFASYGLGSSQTQYGCESFARADLHDGTQQDSDEKYEAFHLSRS